MKRRSFVQHPHHHGRWGRVLIRCERWLSRVQRKEGCSERVHIRSRPGCEILKSLGRRILRRQHRSGQGSRRVGKLSDSEISKRRIAIGIQENIRWLDVEVQDTTLVAFSNGICNYSDEPAGLCGLHWPLFIDDLLQGPLVERGH